MVGREIGGTGYAGSAIVAEAASRGHEVTAFSRSLPAEPVPRVTYLQGDAADKAAVSAVIAGADVVVGALSPHGASAGPYRERYRMIARAADAEGTPLFVVGGFSSVRPAPGAPRFVADLSQYPAEFRDGIAAVSAVVTEDLPATPSTLDWVFVSPASKFGSFAPGERWGEYRVGGDVAVQPADGGAISGADYACPSPSRSRQSAAAPRGPSGPLKAQVVPRWFRDAGQAG